MRRATTSLHTIEDIRRAIQDLAIPRHNFDSDANPTINDDVTKGYRVGSVITVTGTRKRFECVRADARNASWAELSTVAGGPVAGFGNLSMVMAFFTMSNDG